MCLALLATQYSVFVNNMSCLAWMFANITMISPLKKHRLFSFDSQVSLTKPLFVLLYERKSQGGTNLSRSYVLNSLTSQHLFLKSALLEIALTPSSSIYIFYQYFHKCSPWLLDLDLEIRWGLEFEVGLSDLCSLRSCHVLSVTE